MRPPGCPEGERPGVQREGLAADARRDHPAPPNAVVHVNGEAHPIAAGAHVASLLAALGHAPDSVAVALNGSFVPRAARADTPLRDGDQLTCFQPIVGG